MRNIIASYTLALSLSILMVPMGSTSHAKDANKDLIEPSERAKIEEMRKRLLIPEVSSTHDDARMMEQLEALMLKNNPANYTWIPPSNAAGIPSGFGGRWSDLFFGGIMSSPQSQGGRYDGALFVGGSLGDPKKYVGVDLTLGIYSIIPSFGRSGGVSGRVHRQLGAGLAAAVGADNLLGWENGSGMTKYAVVSKSVLVSKDEREMFSSLFFHLGIGDGRFSTTQALLEGRSNYNLFAGVGVRVFQPLGVATSWNGSDIILNVSVTPFRKIPIFLGVGFSDFVTNNFSQVPRFNISMTWADSWRSETFGFKAFKDL